MAIVVNKPQNEYPILKQTKEGLVVLFHKKGAGVVVIGNESHEIGHYSTAWAELNFTLYNKPLTIQNV